MIFDGFSWKLGKHARNLAQKESSDPQFGSSTTRGVIVLASKLDDNMRQQPVN